MSDVDEYIKLKNVKNRMKVIERCGNCESSDLGTMFGHAYCNSCGAVEE